MVLDEGRIIHSKDGENLNEFPLCRAWCFIFGLLGIDTEGRPIGCMERKGHDEPSFRNGKTPHRTKIESFGSPKAVFEVTWTVE